MQIQSSAPDIDSHQGQVPQHLAIIMDGNNRWARGRDLPGAEGHRAGEQALQDIVEAAARRGVKALTVFAFSSENWRRPEDEVRHLMALFLRALEKRVDELHDNGIRLRFIGDRSAFSEPLQAGMAAAEARTVANTVMTLAVAVNYGGQWDMAHAAQQLAHKVASGELAADAIDAQCFGELVALADLPPVDLLVRTGGDHRISNFLLWQLAYAELYFCDTLWPDFDEAGLQQALDDYASRQRRFGRSGDEVAAATGEH